MKRFLMTTTAIAVLSLGMLSTADAQTANSESNSSAGAASQSSSSSSSRGGRSQGNTTTTGITFNSPGDTTSRNTSTNTNNSNQTGGFNNRDAVSYSGGTSNSNWNSGDQTLRTTPTVYAPPVSGGNPCTLAVSGGVSVIGWGAAAGGTFVDQDCANRQKIAMVHNAGYAGVAKELMCNDRDTYFAFRSAGQACQPRAQFDGQAAPLPAQPVPPMVQQQPTVVTPTIAPVAAPAQRPLVRCSRTVTDNCYSG